MLTWVVRARLARLRPGHANVAIVVHVFYSEVWPALLERLARVDPDDVDVFVTVPPGNRHVRARIRADLPHARSFVVPNRGRDVFPFLLVAQRLDALGYQAALKIHSKKSDHFSGGARWRDQMLDELLPPDPALLDDILTTLRDDRCGVIGPDSVYFPLSTYWQGNARTIEDLIRPNVPPEAFARLAAPNELGFFAGTMFWARLDALRPLLRVDPLGFVREPTPKDGTLAHALERAMTVLPELSGRRQYGSDSQRLTPRSATAEQVPAWYRDATRAAVRAEERAKRARAPRQP